MCHGLLWPEAMTVRHKRAKKTNCDGGLALDISTFRHFVSRPGWKTEGCNNISVLQAARYWFLRPTKQKAWRSYLHMHLCLAFFSSSSTQIFISSRDATLKIQRLRVPSVLLNYLLRLRRIYSAKWQRQSEMQPRHPQELHGWSPAVAVISPYYFNPVTLQLISIDYTAAAPGVCHTA